MRDDDAHAAVTRIVWACEHGLRAGVVCNAGWLRAWLIDWCSNKDARKSERKTPTTLPTGRAKTRKKERTRERERREGETINKPRTMLLSNVLLVPDHRIYWTFFVGLRSSFLCG